jgi:MFS family permease
MGSATTIPSYCGLRGRNLVYLITFCCSIGYLLFSYDQAYMGGVTTSEEFLGTFNEPNASLLGFIVSSYDVGCMLGAIASLCVGDRLGRRPMIIIGGGIVLVGAILQASSFSLAQLLVGRIVGGLVWA